ncbi:MAG: hypothetical protein QOF30_2723 [Acidimicrobiaceae bacterium]|jgi:hypothetical protein|nr:hypothetical protein [Acidimicrobiaceae bacterium]
MFAVVLAGIIAKGLGVIAGIFFAGMIIGVALTVSVTMRIRRFGRR